MVGPEAGQLGFRVAFFLVLVSGAVLLFQKPGTAEFIVTAFSLLLGILFAVLIAALARVWK